MIVGILVEIRTEDPFLLEPTAYVISTKENVSLRTMPLKTFGALEV
jgi:hypothetical protein